jgi:hypothetical protein
VRRELVVGQRLPVRQQAHAQLAREPGELLHQALRIERRRGDEGERLFLRRQTSDRQRVGGAGEPRIAPAGGERIAMHQRKKRVIISS